jgi:hypothetical protein
MPNQLFLLGTGEATTGSPLGPDNSCDQQWDGSAWSQVLPVNTLNGFLSSACYDPVNDLFLLFGNTDSSNPAYSYKRSTNTYTNLANLPATCFGEGAAASLNGVAYCIGGVTSAPAASNVVFSYNVGGAAYSTAFATLATGVSRCMAVTVESLIYHGGGENNFDGGGTPQSSWFKWDPLTDTRTPMASMPVAVAGAAIAYANGFIWLFGGSTGVASNYAGSTTVQRYDVAANTWSSTFNAFPLAVSNACAAVFNGTFWIAGGVTTAFLTFTNSVRTYSPGTDTYASQTALTNAMPGSILAQSPPASPSDVVWFGTDA